MSSPGDANKSYFVAFAATNSTGITLPDSRTIPLDNDWLLGVSLLSNNGIFLNTLGQLDAGGNTTVQMAIPAMPILINQTIYAATVVFDATAPLGLRRISQPLPIVFR